MALDTPLDYRNLVIYSIYVRNHGPNGTFADVEGDLKRIRSMGVDVIWFIPIHPIGRVQKKGSWAAHTPSPIIARSTRNMELAMISLD